MCQVQLRIELMLIMTQTDKRKHNEENSNTNYELTYNQDYHALQPTVAYYKHVAFQAFPEENDH